MNKKTLELERLHSKDPKVKYGFVKELLKTGADRPELLYDYFDNWREMMNSNNNILKWTAIDIIGYLSSVDSKNKTDGEIKNLFHYLHGGHLITSAHSVFALGLIAKNKPEHRKKIIKELIAVSKDRFDTEECKNIATGKVIQTLNNFLDDIRDNKEILHFIRQAQYSKRNATKKKADELIKKIKN